MGISKLKQLGFPASESNPNISVKILIKLFEIKGCTSIDCDNLIGLINTILESILDEKNENSTLKYIFNGCDLKQLWKLYFDPLS